MGEISAGRFELGHPRALPIKLLSRVSFAFIYLDESSAFGQPFSQKNIISHLISKAEHGNPLVFDLYLEINFDFSHTSNIQQGKDQCLRQ